ncbi:MAG: phosphate/phosphite/phosphonate ABC transporter substrate-binding protein [Desulfobulbaceae bacterium]
MFDKTSYIVQILILACVLSLFLFGCRDQQQDMADSDELNSKKVFYIGISPEQNIFRQRDRHEPLAAYLSEKLGIKIELRMAGSYGSLIGNMQSGEVDAVFLGSYAGAVAQKKLEAQPLARIQYPDGISTYRGVIFTRKESGIAGAQEMKDKTFVFVDRTTTAGWLFPLHFFKENGIDDPATWLGESYYAGTHEDAILDVVNKKADIGAAKDTIFARIAASDKRVADQLTILDTSPPVPANTILVRRDVEASLKKKLRETLLAMHLDKEGKQALEKLGAAKFVATSEEDYEPVFAYAEEVGVDISTYTNAENPVEKQGE